MPDPTTNPASPGQRQSTTSHFVDTDGVLHIVIAGPPIPVADFYQLLGRALSTYGWAPGQGVIEDVRELTGLPPLSCIKAMVDYFQALPDRVRGSRWAIVLPANLEAPRTVFNSAEVLAVGGPVTLRVFTDMDAASEWARSSAVRTPPPAAWDSRSNMR